MGLKGKAHTLAEDTVVNTDTIRVGYLVVKAQWLRLEQRECEGTGRRRRRLVSVAAPGVLRRRTNFVYIVRAEDREVWITHSRACLSREHTH